MASCSSLLSEDQFQCSICLDVFTDPVSIPCGHNYCKACITRHWDNSDLCQCPLCQRNFPRKPDIFVNTMFRDVVEKFKKNAHVKKESQAKPEDVSCDICTGTKLKALKSCLVCLASYCETHLEPHQRVAALKKHKLIDPVENLEDRMCQKHYRPLELFCRTDHTCVCFMCMRTDHRTHDTVTLEEEYRPKKDDLRKMMEEMKQMMEQRSRKVEEIKLSVETGKRDADKVISDSVEVFTALLRSIQSIQAELIEVIEEKQRAAEKQAEGFIKDLEQEITELERRLTDLEQLSHTEDHLHLLQSLPSLSIPPHTKDWSEIRVHSGLSVGAVGRAMSQLEETLKKEMDKLPEVKLKRIQQYAVDVTLDPDTAHPYLILSEDGKQVRCGHIKQDLPDNPERFTLFVNVLGKQGFSSGKFYYEVQVEGKTNWNMGVARETIDRKGKITFRPEKEYWIVFLRRGNLYKAVGPSGYSVLSLKQKPQKVGVFVAYEEGLVSFYDVEARSHICSFTGCFFTEKLYPFFNPCGFDEGKNSVPLIITPVNY